MKYIIVIVGLLLSIPSSSLIAIWFIDQRTLPGFPPILCAWILLQGVFFTYIGERMMNGKADYRIAGVVMFVLGQAWSYVSYGQWTDIREVGFAMGIILAFAGFFLGTCSYFSDKDALARGGL